MKRHLFLGKKAMTNLDSILKSIDIHIVKTIVFPVVMYECESWTLKKADRQRIDVFKLWCWRRLLKVPWTARSNQLILKEISPEYSLEGLMLNLKLQYFGHLMWRTESLEKTLMLGKIEGRRGRQGDEMVWWHYLLNGHEFEQDSGDGEEQGSLACCSPWGHRVGHNWRTKQQERVDSSKTLEDLLQGKDVICFKRLPLAAMWEIHHSWAEGTWDQPGSHYHGPSRSWWWHPGSGGGGGPVVEVGSTRGRSWKWTNRPGRWLRCGQRRNRGDLLVGEH